MIKNEFKISKQVERFYTQCLNCPVSQNGCLKAWKNPSEGIVPRGFDFCRRRYPNILIVSKNPGHPLTEYGEDEFYKGKKGKRLFDSYVKFRKELADNIIYQKNASLRFHKNRNRYLRYLLGHTSKLESFKQYSERIEEGSFIWDFEKIMRDVALTNLFKCSTRNEQQKLLSADVSVCVERYFLPEVKLLKPKVILAFGNEVANFLIRLGLHEHLPPIIKIKHPSRPYGKEEEVHIMSAVRKALKKYL